MRVKLSDPWFEAKFIHGITPKLSFRLGAEFAGAQGLWLWCPCAYQKAHRAHGLIVPFAGRNVPDGFGPTDDSGARPRWKVEGSGILDLTIKPSVLVGTPKDCCWHGHITQGTIT